VNTAHLTTTTKTKTGWLAACLCGWSEESKTRKGATADAWNHWASKPVVNR